MKATNEIDSTLNYCFQIDDKDVYPKIICDECLRELLIVAKFKEKVKLSENTLGQLIASDDKVSYNSDGVVIEETEEAQVDDFSMIKEETDVEEECDEEEEVVTESYEEVEFLDMQGQSETLSGVQFVTIDKCDDDEFIDEIIEECSVEDDLVDIIVNETVNVSNRNIVKVRSHQFLPILYSDSTKNVQITEIVA